MRLGEEALEGWGLGLERWGEWQIQVDFEKKGMEVNLLRGEWQIRVRFERKGMEVNLPRGHFPGGSQGHCCWHWSPPRGEQWQLRGAPCLRIVGSSTKEARYH
jgi:hypothetical protein